MDKHDELLQLYSRLINERTSHILLYQIANVPHFTFAIEFRSAPELAVKANQINGKRGIVKLMVTYNPEDGIKLDGFTSDKAVLIISSCLRLVMLNLYSFPYFDFPYDTNAALNAYLVLGKLIQLPYYTELAAAANIPERYKYIPNSKAEVRRLMALGLIMVNSTE